MKPKGKDKSPKIRGREKQREKPSPEHGSK